MADGAPQDILGSFLETNDGLSKLAQLFARMGGRELSPDALQCISFLRSNGSGDLAESIIADKVYQLSVDDLTKMTEKMSMATAYEKTMQIQGEAFKARGA